MAGSAKLALSTERIQTLRGSPRSPIKNSQPARAGHGLNQTVSQSIEHHQQIGETNQQQGPKGCLNQGYITREVDETATDTHQQMKYERSG
jgi:hypothetical protein